MRFGCYTNCHDGVFKRTELARTHRASEMMLAVNVLGCAKPGTAKLTAKLPVILLAVSVELHEVTLVRTEMPALVRLFIAAVPVRPEPVAVP